MRAASGAVGLVAAAGEAHVGNEVGEHHLLDARLTERRQHLLDVAQEDPVGPDHQHALVFEREAMRVQQVGGPVQGDDGLAGTRAHPGRRARRLAASG